MVSSFGIFSLGSKMKKVIFTYYFPFCLVYSCIWTLSLAYGLWNDYGCPFLLSSVGYTETDQIQFCEFLFCVLSKSSLNCWFRSTNRRLEKELWDTISKHKLLPLSVFNSSFQISYCQQRSCFLLMMFKMICPFMNALRLSHKANGEGADASFNSK